MARYKEPEEECCGTCYFHRTNIDKDWVCTNMDSDNFSLETEYSDRCDEYTGRR